WRTSSTRRPPPASGPGGRWPTGGSSPTTTSGTCKRPSIAWPRPIPTTSGAIRRPAFASRSSPATRWSITTGPKRGSRRSSERRRVRWRRWNDGLFRGRYVSIHPTRAEDEITEGYGARPSSPCGPATIAARVTDVADAGFLPAVYKVADATVEDGPPAAIEEVVVFEALF